MSEIEQMRSLAKQALDDYNQEIQGGGEPPFPEWAARFLANTGRRDATESRMHERTGRR